MPKKPRPPLPSSQRKVDRPSSKPPVGGKSTKSEFGDYMGGKDLGQSKGRSAAVGRRAAGIRALANNTQGKIMSTKPKPAAKKALPKSMISGSLAKGKPSSGNIVQRSVDTVAKGAGKVANAYLNATIKYPAKFASDASKAASKALNNSFAGKAPSKTSTRPVRGAGNIGPEFGSRPQRPVTRRGGSKAGDMRKAAAAEVKSAAKGAKAGAKLKQDLSRVDYGALGKLMASERSKAKKTKMK